MGIVHDQAVQLAIELRVPNIERIIGPRPSLPECCLAVRRVLSDARQKEERDPLAAHWMQDSPDAHDWVLKSMSQKDVENYQRHASTLRAAEAQTAAVISAIHKADISGPHFQNDDAVRLIQAQRAPAPPPALEPTTPATKFLAPIPTPTE
jgi:hypothetical protein